MKIDTLIKNGFVVSEQQETVMAIAISNGKILAMGQVDDLMAADETIDASGLVIFPGLVDPHVHFREPRPNEEEDFAGQTRLIHQPYWCFLTTQSKRVC